MRIVLDKNLPEYRKDVERLKKAVTATAGHPRGVFCFKTFAEFAHWKDEYELLRPLETQTKSIPPQDD